MSKITERNTDRSTIKTWGSASVSPADDVVVGSFATWTLTYTVGAYAMDVGGGLKIGTRRQADFGTPQFDDPAMAETGRKVIMVPHIGGRRSDFQAQDPELEPVFEICSNHGIFEWRLHEFLLAGVHVGVVGASDDHTCRPGLALDESAATGERAYWVRVEQTDGHRAWSSPIYVTVTGGPQ